MMKYFKSIAAVVLAISLVISCGKNSDKEMSEMGDNMKEQVDGQAGNMQAQFVSGVEKEINDMEDGMDEVKTEIDKKTGAEKTSLQEEWNKIKTQKQEIESMIAKVKNGEVENWSQMKTDIQDQWASLQNSYKNIRAKLNLS